MEIKIKKYGYYIQETALKTLKGMPYLNENRLYFGEPVAGAIYLLSMMIFYITRIGYFGLNGYNLSINSDPLQIDAVFRLTFLQETVLNFALGFIVVGYWAIMILIVSKLSKNFMSGIVSALVMIAINFFGKYIYSLYKLQFLYFLPFNMIKNRNCYKVGEIILMGKNIPTIIFLITVSILGIIVFHYGFLKFSMSEKREV